MSALRYDNRDSLKRKKAPGTEPYNTDRVYRTDYLKTLLDGAYSVSNIFCTI